MNKQSRLDQKKAIIFSSLSLESSDSSKTSEKTPEKGYKKRGKFCLIYSIKSVD
jgi:hypothetical protein